MPLCDFSKFIPIKKSAKFLNSNYFLIILSAIIFLCWAGKALFLGLSLVFMISAFIFITQKDTAPFMSVMLTVFYIIPFFFMPDKIGYEHILGGIYIILLIGAIIYNLVAYAPYRVYSAGRLFGYIVAAFAGGMVGGIGYVKAAPFFSQLSMLIAVAAIYLVVYFLAYNTMRLDTTSFKRYFAKIFLCSSIIVTLEMLMFFIRAEDVISAINYKTLTVGWGNTNTVGTILMACLPFSFYLATQYRNGGVFVFAAILQYAALWFTHSRGCIIISTVFMALAGVYIIIRLKGANRYIAIAAYSILALVALFMLTIFSEQFAKYFGALLNKKLSDAGRFDLYKEAVGDFLAHPIFGNSYFYKINDDMIMYWYHNIPLQLLANLGIVGTLPFAALYYIKYKIALTNIRSGFRHALLAFLVMMDCYGMIDVILFIPFHAFTIMLVMVISDKTSIPDSEIIETESYAGL